MKLFNLWLGKNSVVVKIVRFYIFAYFLKFSSVGPALLSFPAITNPAVCREVMKERSIDNRKKTRDFPGCFYLCRRVQREIPASFL